MRLWSLSKSKKAKRKSQNQKVKGKSFDFLLVVLPFSFLVLTLVFDAAFALENRSFESTIDFLNKDITFNLDLKENGKLEASGGWKENKYNIKLALKHIKFGKSDILSEFYASGIITRSPEGKPAAIKGRAWTQGSLLNFKPLKEFSADYELSNAGFIIHSLSWADLDIKGQVKSLPVRQAGVKVGSGFKPFPTLQRQILVNLFLTIKEMELSELAGLLGINSQDVDLAGKVSGEARIRGPGQAVKIEAKLTASDGKVSRIKFSSAKLILEGIWPILRLVSAQINDMGGIVYELKGQFNLKKLSDFASSQHQVAVSSANNTMRFQDWIIRRQADEKGQDTVEAEYPIKNNQALKMRIKNQEETLGWEKSVKF